MNKKNIDEKIKFAIKCIRKYIDAEKFFKKGNDDWGKIPKVFEGYIANFSASIMQSGILPTVMFFSRKESNSQEDKRIILSLLFRVMENYKKDMDTEKDVDIEDECIKLVQLFVDKKVDEDEFVDSVIALKLAFRVYEFTKEMSEDEVQ